MAVDRDARASWSPGGRIDGPADVGRVLAAANATGLHRGNTAAMPVAVHTAQDTAFTDPDVSRTRPVMEELRELVPWAGGLRHGATVAAVGSHSVLLALLGGAMTSGAWGAVVGVPGLGVLAAAEYHIALERLALVPDPGPDWPTVVAALIDGIPIVAVRPPPGAVSDGVTRSLMARARQRGCVLLVLTADWPSCDLTIELVERRWSGLGAGRGRLREQTVLLRASGRGRSSRLQTITTSLPPRSLGYRPWPYGQPSELDGSTPAAAQSTPVMRRRPPPDPQTTALPDPWADLLHRLPPAEPTRRRRR